MGKNRRPMLLKACPPVLTGFFVLISLLITTSCDTAKQQGEAAGKIMPNITGGAGEVLVAGEVERKFPVPKLSGLLKLL